MNEKKELSNRKVGASAEAIKYHYDLGYNFYSIWLGKSCIYSCALWDENDTSDIELAQEKKIDFHINSVKAKRAENVLDIGCGWGAVLLHLVNNYNVNHAVGLTLSNEQAKWISSLNNPKISVLTESWIDHFIEIPYDSIISIGAFEHFAQPKVSKKEKINGYRLFFKKCHTLLKKGGYMSLQTMAMGNMPPWRFLDDKKIMYSIFPETELPLISEIFDATKNLFEIIILRNDRKNYEKTFSIWLKNLETHSNEAEKIVGLDIVLKYKIYLNSMIKLFREDCFSLLRIVMHRID